MVGRYVVVYGNSGPGKSTLAGRIIKIGRESLLLYIINNWRQHVRKTKQELATVTHHTEIIELCSSREGNDFLSRLDADN